GIVVDPKQRYCVVWKSWPAEQSRPHSSRLPAGSDQSNLSVILFRPPPAGVQPPSTTLDRLIKQVVLMDDKLAIQFFDQANEIDIYDIRTLRRKKRLLAGSVVQSIAYGEGELKLKGSTTEDVFDGGTLVRLRTNDTTPVNRYGRNVQATFRDGVLKDGILRADDQSPPKLLVNPTQFLQLRGANSSLARGSFLRQVRPATTTTTNRRSSSSNSWTSPRTRLNNGAQVSLETSNMKVGDDVWVAVTDMMIYSSDGQLIERRKIAQHPKLPSTQWVRPAIVTAGDYVFIGIDRLIYRQSVPAAAASLEEESDEPDDFAEFHFAAEQDALVMTRKVEKLD
ncbi:unnamed protein product, partial [Hapterophycus canaliculatus]